jgi:hypothetical protein
MGVDGNKVFKAISNHFCAGHQPDVKWVYGPDVPVFLDSLLDRLFARYGVRYTIEAPATSCLLTATEYLNYAIFRTVNFYAEEMENAPNAVLMAGLRDIANTVDPKVVSEAYASLQERVSELARENLNDMLNGRGGFPHRLVDEIVDNGVAIIERAIDAAHNKKAA